MQKQELRTYKRRKVTRQSGFHTCDEFTGSECKIISSERYQCIAPTEQLELKKNNVELVCLWNSNKALLAFGGIIKASTDMELFLHMSYEYNGKRVTETPKQYSLDANEWTNIGLHSELEVSGSKYINELIVLLELNSKDSCYVDLACFDLDSVKKEEFKTEQFKNAFTQKTEIAVPYLYYLRTDLRMSNFFHDSSRFSEGELIILKSCNRCGRFIPININDQNKTLGFSLHCKKRAPCKHKAFSEYSILNLDEIKSKNLSFLSIKDGKVYSYYGHQIECKACKKFFVNAPLNPQRTPQQRKEDGLRRRAFEPLICSLLKIGLIHHEFEKKTKKEFSEYIWNKFDRRCFKCGENSKQITLKQMDLDHTMPLAYLYRLDETATCLCEHHNSEKSDSFPVDYYSESELERLSKITGIPLEKLKSKTVNKEVLSLLVDNIVWYFEIFLMNPNYQKIRGGIKTANKINDAIVRVTKDVVNIVEEYKKKTGHYPTSIDLKQATKK